jgi:chromosome segregation ATPase
MADAPKLRSAFFRGYRRGDVELALARFTIARDRLEFELAAANARATAMQAEIDDLHRRLDTFRDRERDLAAALDEVRERREQLERAAELRAQQIVGEAEQRAAALRTDGLRQVGELQLQVEQLLALRSGLATSLKRATQDISDALDRVAAAPAHAAQTVEPPAPEPEEMPSDSPFAPWSREPER